MSEKLRMLSPRAWETDSMVWVGSPQCLLYGHKMELKKGKNGEWHECVRCQFIVFREEV